MRTPKKSSPDQPQPDSGIVGILLKIVGVTALGIAGVMMFTNPVRADEVSGKMKSMSANASEARHAGSDSSAVAAEKMPAR